MLISLAFMMAAAATPADGPDFKGNDPDVACMLVMASKAQNAKAAGKVNGLYESAAGYFVGTVTTRYGDDRLKAVYDQLISTFGASDSAPFEQPCLDRFLVALKRLQAVIPPSKS